MQVQKTSATRGKLDPTWQHASHLRKPQLSFKKKVDNNNDLPWYPTLPHKYNAQVPLGYQYYDSEGNVGAENVTAYVISSRRHCFRNERNCHQKCASIPLRNQTYLLPPTNVHFFTTHPPKILRRHSIQLGRRTLRVQSHARETTQSPGDCRGYGTSQLSLVCRVCVSDAD